MKHNETEHYENIDYRQRVTSGADPASKTYIEYSSIGSGLFFLQCNAKMIGEPDGAALHRKAKMTTTTTRRRR